MMASAYGVPCATTLTGFKWIARSAGDGTLGFGYEEALGFAVDAHVADKDGMSAGTRSRRRWPPGCGARDVSCSTDSTNSKVVFGVHATKQLSLRAEGPDGLTSDPPAWSLGLLASPPTSARRDAR